MPDWDTGDYETYNLGDFVLKSGKILPEAWIAYKTWGDSKNPAILYGPWYSSYISGEQWMIGEDKTLSPKEYFIVLPAMFGNGQSISPSNSNISPFPEIHFYDNVKAQYRLLTEKLGISHLRAVTGWSMGGGHSFQWAVQYPDFMDICVPSCGAARTAIHNQVMLEGAKAALLAGKGASSAGSKCDRIEEKGQVSRIWSKEQKEVGLKALGRVYAGWGMTQAFYRERLYEKVMGYKDLEDFMLNFWKSWALCKDPENMLVMLRTWQMGDVSQQEPFNGDFEQAMASIKAKTLVLPCKYDLYFRSEDSEYEVACMSPGVGKLEVCDSIWGHWAGGPPGSVEDVNWVDERLAHMLADN